MGKKDKKKGKGAEKTAMKTEKKALNKIKKTLAAKGEDDIEKLIAECQKRSFKKPTSSLELCPQPSPRSGFSFCAHPDKDELILFGGEFYNGSRTIMYNEVYFYNIKKQKWSVLQCPDSPPPRCSHQAVVVSQNGGQMWIFGGEFASPTKSNFYHYKDLWVLHFSTMTWEQIKAPCGPPPRSGHRMVVTRKQLVVFGGFHEIIGDYKYFNDVHIFNLETYSWSKIEPVGKVPHPRSGCQMAALTDGRILIYGGYSKEKVKKDVDKGVCHTDMFYLQVDEKTGTQKWKWVQTKPNGNPPSARSSLSICVTANNNAFAFGGVHDEEDDEESLSGIFLNDLYQLELDKGRWQTVILQSKGAKTEKKKRRKVKDGEELRDEESDEENIAEEFKKTTLVEQEAVVKTYDDDIFTVKIGPSTSQTTEGACSSETTSRVKTFVPKGRMNAGMTVKNGILYLYGGLYEDGDRQFTLSDFYFMDIHKLDEWQILVPYSTGNLEWIESEESESSDDDSDMDMAAKDEDDSEDDDGMDTE